MLKSYKRPIEECPCAGTKGEFDLGQGIVIRRANYGAKIIDPTAPCAIQQLKNLIQGDDNPWIYFDQTIRIFDSIPCHRCGCRVIVKNSDGSRLNFVRNISPLSS